MASTVASPADPAVQAPEAPQVEQETKREIKQDGHPESQAARVLPSRIRTPEPSGRLRNVLSNTSGISGTIPDTPEPFDWDDFERRFEQALQDADENEKQILKEVENLSACFRAWASAASTRDDERAAKRLQTRRRFVNMAEERMEQKQRHYTQVVRAFESALALLKS